MLAQAALAQLALAQPPVVPPPAPPTPTSGPSKNDIFLYPVKAFANPNDIKLVVLTKPAGTVGWMPEWRLRHDPEELERRLEAQRGFGRKWYDRFLEAEKAALEQARTAAQREAAEEAIDAVGARVSDAIEYGYELPADLIQSLEALAQFGASISYANALAAAAAEYLAEEDEEIAMLLLH